MSYWFGQWNILQLSCRAKMHQPHSFLWSNRCPLPQSPLWHWSLMQQYRCFLQCTRFSLRHSFHVDPDTWSLTLIWATMITEKPCMRAQDQFFLQCRLYKNKTETLLNAPTCVHVYLCRRTYLCIYLTLITVIEEPVFQGQTSFPFLSRFPK